MRSHELLLRQVHPNFVQKGRVTSQAFRPTPKDEQRLSVYDGNLIEPPAAWQHYTNTLGQASLGVMAVSRTECAVLTLPVRPDPEPFPEHVVIDFSGYTKNQIEAKAKELKRHADARGWLFRAAGGRQIDPNQRTE